MRKPRILLTFLTALALPALFGCGGGGGGAGGDDASTSTLSLSAANASEMNKTGSGNAVGTDTPKQTAPAATTIVT